MHPSEKQRFEQRQGRRDPHNASIPGVPSLNPPCRNSPMEYSSSTAISEVNLVLCSRGRKRLLYRGAPQIFFKRSRKLANLKMCEMERFYISLPTPACLLLAGTATGQDGGGGLPMWCWAQGHSPAHLRDPSCPLERTVAGRAVTAISPF